MWLSLSCVCVCVRASCFCVHVGCGAGLYIKGRGSGASTYSPGHWEGWVPGTPVFYDPCVAGPQAPGRTGLGDSREADGPGPLPAEPGLPCPVTQRPEGTPGSRWSGPTFDGWGNRGPRAHSLWWPWQPLMPGMAPAAPPPSPQASASSSVPGGLVPSHAPLAQRPRHRAGRGSSGVTRQVESSLEAGSKNSKE